jgi:membrane protease subunit (stomatin/prohibitin family)
MRDVQVIKYEGSSDELVWGYPEEVLYEGATLIVDQGFTALYVENGIILEEFSEGKYHLDIEYIKPKEGIIFKKKYTPTHTNKIYFFNTDRIQQLKWGTVEPIQVKDPIYQIILPIRSYGEMKFKISNPQKFFLKLATEQKITNNELLQFVRDEILRELKGIIIEYIESNQIDFLHLEGYLSEISDIFYQKTLVYFREIGLDLERAVVASLTIPKDDSSFLKLKEAMEKSKQGEILAEGKQKELTILETSHEKERIFNLMEKISEKESLANSEALNTLVNATFTGKDNTAHKLVKRYCPNCGEEIDSEDHFCSNCGQKLIQHCPECGNTIDPGMKFCPKCGKSIQ